MAVTDLYDIGDKRTLAFDLGVAGVAVTALALSPSGVETTLAVTEGPAGVYTATVTPDEPGRWHIQFTAPDSVEVYELVVRSSRFDLVPDRSDVAYGEVADVARLTQGRTFSATSRPSTSEIVDFLALTAAQIDGTLRAKGYQAPVAASATAARRLLAHANALGAAYLVEQAAPTRGGEGRLDEARRLWETFLGAISTGALELEAATRDTTTTRPRSHTTATATFRVGMDH